MSSPAVNIGYSLPFAAILERTKSVCVCVHAGFGFSLVGLAEGQRSPGEGGSGRPRPLRYHPPQTPDAPVAAVCHDLPEVQIVKDRKDTPPLLDTDTFTLADKNKSATLPKMRLKSVNIVLSLI